MKIYLVGGAVRDGILGLESREKDWVVVGGNAKELLHLGYRSVGKDFPVFLHPETSEEYALARRERKVAPGYAGFEFLTDSEVPLEEDLLRRDLTINAMARDDEGGLVDPKHDVCGMFPRLLSRIRSGFSGLHASWRASNP
jgi:tRNA nucleotidyltransferase (CCA-adding enzyme)